MQELAIGIAIAAACLVLLVVAVKTIGARQDREKPSTPVRSDPAPPTS